MSTYKNNYGKLRYINEDLEEKPDTVCESQNKFDYF